MSPFNFEPIQILDIKPEDNPQIDVKDGLILIKASRGSDRIVITAPLQSVLPSPVQTTVRASSNNREHSRTYRRQPAIKPGTLLPADHGAVGENSSNAKLTEVEVREMRALSNDPSYTQTFENKQQMLYDLAKVYKIHWTTVRNILINKSWKHVAA
jgi:hypothetical protein